MDSRIFFWFLVTAAALPSTRSACSINIQKGLGHPETLILKSGTKENGYEAFYLPTENKEVYLEQNEVIVVACPGSTVKVSGIDTHGEQMDAVCISGNFKIEGKTVPFSSITCTKLPVHTARMTNETCLDFDQHKVIEIGFHLKKSDRFIRQVTTCFNEESLSNEYSFFTTSKSIGAFETGVPRPNFVQDDFYPFGVNSHYDRKKQRTTINKLLGLPANSTKYIAATSNYYLSRGHIAAKADFIYGTQQRATFHYVNAAPQWQTLNKYNWNTLEQDIRTYLTKAVSFETRYTLYAGTHAITTLPHEETGEDTEIFLHVDGDYKAIATPQLFWRILKNEDTNEAVAFVSINNPYHKDVSDEIICKSVCDKLTWLHWKVEDIEKGYSYCCTVEDLRRTVKNVPEFKVEGLLV